VSGLDSPTSVRSSHVVIPAAIAARACCDMAVLPVTCWPIRHLVLVILCKHVHVRVCHTVAKPLDEGVIKKTTEVVGASQTPVVGASQTPVVGASHAPVVGASQASVVGASQARREGGCMEEGAPKGDGTEAAEKLTQRAF